MSSKQGLTRLTDYEIGYKRSQEPLLLLGNWSIRLHKKSKWEHTYPNNRHIPQSASGTPSFTHTAHEDEWTLSYRSVSGISSSAL